MVAGKNYNIQTVCKMLRKGAQANIGDAVAAGMTRYVTYVRVTQMQNPAGDYGSRVFFCSVANSGGLTTIASASANQKLQIAIPSSTASNVLGKTVALPLQPDTKNPLFTVAASKYLEAKIGSAVGGTSVTCIVFVQYYDQ